MLPFSRSNYCWLKTTNAQKGDHGDWVRGEPCTSEKNIHFSFEIVIGILITSYVPHDNSCTDEINPGQMKGCQCNKHLSAKGKGECNSVANCGSWCYVDDDAMCLDTFPSLNGEPYRWTCEACLNNAGRSHHGLIQLLIALSGFF